MSSYKRCSQNFTIEVVAKSDDFVKTPQPLQRREWMTRALLEIEDDLRHLSTLAERVVSATPRPEIVGDWKTSAPVITQDELIIEGQQVMQAWEVPLMEALAKIVTRRGGDVLEIGFGLGMSATAIQKQQPRSHTIVEANLGVASSLKDWRARYERSDIRVLEGTWEERLPDLAEYDGILWDAYATSQTQLDDEFANQVFSLPQAFFPHAARHLKPGGVFTYFSSEADTLSRSHQRALLSHFSSIEISVVDGLEPPENCQYWWLPTMAVVAATK